jgi:Flp pilus assembly protein TadG
MHSVIYRHFRNLFSRLAGLHRHGPDPCLGSKDALTRNGRGFLKERKAAVAVEFAMVAVPAVLTLCAILAIGLHFFMVAALDHATLIAARAIATGAVSTNALSASSFQSKVVCPALPSMFNCGNVFANLTIVPQGQSPSAYYSYVNANRSGLIQPPLDTAQDTFCPGAGAQYIVLQLLYPAPFPFAFLTAGAATKFKGQQVSVLMSSTAFKSEPYTGATSYQGC